MWIHNFSQYQRKLFYFYYNFSLIFVSLKIFFSIKHSARFYDGNCSPGQMKKRRAKFPSQKHSNRNNLLTKFSFILRFFIVPSQHTHTHVYIYFSLFFSTHSTISYYLLFMIAKLLLRSNNFPLTFVLVMIDLLCSEIQIQEHRSYNVWVSIESLTATLLIQSLPMFLIDVDKEEKLFLIIDGKVENLIKTFILDRRSRSIFISASNPAQHSIISLTNRECQKSMKSAAASPLPMWYKISIYEQINEKYSQTRKRKRTRRRSANTINFYLSQCHIVTGVVTSLMCIYCTVRYDLLSSNSPALSSSHTLITNDNQFRQSQSHILIKMTIYFHLAEFYCINVRIAMIENLLPADQVITRYLSW